MVEIFKGDMKMEVTHSAYENFYKSAGWLTSVRPLTKPLPKTAKKVEVETEEEDVEEEDWDDVIEEEDENEKPLSQMNNTELIEKAVSLGLNVSGNVTNKQLREMIKKHGTQR